MSDEKKTPLELFTEAAQVLKAAEVAFKAAQAAYVAAVAALSEAVTDSKG